MKKTRIHSFVNIARNKRANYDYNIESKFEAGLCLMGWEVKSLRFSRVQLTQSYVLIKNSEIFLVGTHFSPLNTISTHIVADPLRERKLLLNKKEIARLFLINSKKGFTIIALSLYWKDGIVKCEIALARGKKLYDKRETEKERDWNRNKSRILSCY